MKTIRRFSLLTAALSVAALTSLVPCSTAAESERHEQKELPAASGGTLTFKAVVGAIDVRTHDHENVTYDAVLKPGGWTGGGAAALEQIEFAYEQSGGDVKITMKWKGDKPPRRAGLDVRHTLLVPKRYHLDVRTAGGRIEGQDIDGRVAAHTSGGSIRFGRVNGEVKAHTSGGSITLEEVNGHASIDTSGGSITVGKVNGNVVAHTSGGDIKVETVSGELKGTTSGGSISAELTGQIAKPLELTTSGGSITLRVPGDFKANLEASTSGGNVNCDLPVEGTVKRAAIKAKVNGGGPNVTLHTSGGSIKVAKR